MYFGVSWPRFICFSVSMLASMLAGAQAVHEIYKPLSDLDELIEKALNERLKQAETT